jgi:hypothetical protein
VPGQITAIPLFIIMVRLGWVDTYQGVILPGLVPAFGVFLMRMSAEEAIPDELLEAARIDGANELQIYFQVALPNLLPHMAALSIFLFVGSWGSLFWPIIVLRTTSMFTLPVALSSIIGSYGNPYDLLLAGSLLAVLPPLLLFFATQRFFVKSLVAGAFRWSGACCALAISDIANPSFATTASAAQDYAHQFGCSLTVYNTHDDAERESSDIQMASERWTDGVLFVAAQDWMDDLATLEEADIPSVAVERIPVPVDQQDRHL